MSTYILFDSTVTPGFSFFLFPFPFISLLFMSLFLGVRLRRQQNPGLFGKMRTSASSRFVPEDAEAPPSDPDEDEEEELQLQIS